MILFQLSILAERSNWGGFSFWCFLFSYASIITCWPKVLRGCSIFFCFVVVDNFTKKDIETLGRDVTLQHMLWTHLHIQFLACMIRWNENPHIAIYSYKMNLPGHVLSCQEVSYKMRIIISFAKEASILILKWDCDNENAMNTTETRKLYIVSSNLCRRIRIRTKVMIAWLKGKTWLLPKSDWVITSPLSYSIWSLINTRWTIFCIIFI